jgi:hypothetical protein
LNTLGTIVSEFPGYTFQSASELDELTLSILYAEARRQRAAKATMLAALLNKHQYDKKAQEKITDAVHACLNPFDDQLNPQKFDDAWEALRRKQL